MRKQKTHRLLQIKHRERWIASGRLLLIFLLGWLVLTGLGIIFATMGENHLPVSVNILEVHNWSDWLMIGLMVATILWGGFSLYYYLARRRNSKWWYWLGNFGLIGSVGGALALAEEFHMKLISRLTVHNVKLMVTSVSAAYYVLFGLTVAMLFVALLLNQHWTQKNNWYAFSTAAPYIVLGAFVYRSWLQWQSFLGLKQFSYQRIYDMIHDYNQYGLGRAVELASMNEPVKILAGMAMADLSITIIIGGIALVWKANQKIRQKGTKGPTQGRKTSAKAS